MGSSLFGDLDDFTVQGEEWKDMPEFEQKELKPFREIIVRFESKEDVDAFAKLINQNITTLTKYLWFPEITIEKYMDKRWIDGK
jgi:hypothetical protein